MTDTTVTMDATIDSKTLKAALASLKKTANNRNLPIIAGMVKMETRDGIVEMTTTNLDASLSVTLPASSATHGTAVLDLAALQDMATGVGTVSINVNGAASISNSLMQRKATQFPAEDYPIVPRPASDGYEYLTTFDATALKAACATMCLAVSQDDTRPILTGAYFEIPADEHATITATDGYRLAHLTVEHTPRHDVARTILVSRATLKILSQLLTPKAGRVAVYRSANGTQAIFSADTFTLVTRLIEGQFPNWRQIMPRSFDATAVVNTAELRDAAKVAKAQKDTTPMLTVETTHDGTVSVSFATGDSGQAAQCQVDAMAEGTCTTAFNPAYLYDALAGETADTVTLSLTPKSACMIGASWVLMPMQINNRR